MKYTNIADDSVPKVLIQKAEDDRNGSKGFEYQKQRYANNFLITSIKSVQEIIHKVFGGPPYNFSREYVLINTSTIDECVRLSKTSGGLSKMRSDDNNVDVVNLQNSYALGQPEYEVTIVGSKSRRLLYFANGLFLYLCAGGLMEELSEHT